MAKPKKEPVWNAKRQSGPLPYAFFISHVREDNEAVQALAAEIRSQSSTGGRLPLTCFLDVESWQIGNDILGVIKEFIPRSEYVVLWGTPAYLTNNRGWVWMELAYAEILEASQNPRVNVRSPYIIPVFQGLTSEQISRTPLLNYWQRGILVTDHERPITDVARKLVAFYEQETRKRAGLPE